MAGPLDEEKYDSFQALATEHEQLRYLFENDFNPDLTTFDPKATPGCAGDADDQKLLVQYRQLKATQKETLLQQLDRLRDLNLSERRNAIKKLNDVLDLDLYAPFKESETFLRFHRKPKHLEKFNKQADDVKWRQLYEAHISPSLLEQPQYQRFAGSDPEFINHYAEFVAFNEKSFRQQLRELALLVQKNRRLGDSIKELSKNLDTPSTTEKNDDDLLKAPDATPTEVNANLDDPVQLEVKEEGTYATLEPSETPIQVLTKKKKLHEKTQEKYNQLRLFCPREVRTLHEKYTKFVDLSREEQINAIRAKKVRLATLTPAEMLGHAVTGVAGADEFGLTLYRNIQVWNLPVYLALFGTLIGEIAGLGVGAAFAATYLYVAHHRSKQLRLIDVIKQLALQTGQSEEDTLEAIYENIDRKNGKLQKLCNELFGEGTYTIDLDFEDGIVLIPNQPSLPTPATKSWKNKKNNIVARGIDWFEDTRFARFTKPLWEALGAYSYFYWLVLMCAGTVAGGSVVGLLATAVAGTAAGTYLFTLGVPAILPIWFLMWRFDKALFHYFKRKGWFGKHPDVAASVLSAAVTYSALITLVHIAVASTLTISLFTTSAFAFGIPVLIPAAYLIAKWGRRAYRKQRALWKEKDLKVETDIQRQQLMAAYFIQEYSQHLANLQAQHCSEWENALGVKFDQEPTCIDAPANLLNPSPEKLANIVRLADPDQQRKRLMRAGLSNLVLGFIVGVFAQWPLQDLLVVLIWGSLTAFPPGLALTMTVVGFAISLGMSMYFFAKEVTKAKAENAKHEESIQKSQEKITELENLLNQIAAQELYNNNLAFQQVGFLQAYNALVALGLLPGLRQAIGAGPDVKFPTREELERFLRTLQMETSESTKWKKLGSLITICVGRGGTGALVVRLICLGGIGSIVFGSTWAFNVPVALGAAVPVGLLFSHVMILAGIAAVLWAGYKMYEYSQNRRHDEDVRLLDNLDQAKRVCTAHLAAEKSRTKGLLQVNHQLAIKVAAGEATQRGEAEPQPAAAARPALPLSSSGYLLRRRANAAGTATQASESGRSTLRDEAEPAVAAARFVPPPIDRQRETTASGPANTTTPTFQRSRSVSF